MYILYIKCAVVLCIWTYSSSFCVISVSTVYLQNVSLYCICTVNVLCCCAPEHVITVSTVQLHTVRFVQYLYSKCAVLLCSWTCSSSSCVITVSTIQLQYVQFVQYLYSKCAVLLCSWTCNYCKYSSVADCRVCTVFVQ
jgi:hypothetical protein